MLHDLLVSERSAILTQCEEKVMKFGGALAAKVTPAGWSLFYDEFVDLITRGEKFEYQAEFGKPRGIGDDGVKDYVRLGYTISDVVRSYRIISQSITDLAQKCKAPLVPEEIEVLDQSLDIAIAEAVDVFDRSKDDSLNTKLAERLGVLAHELRNNLQSATVAFEVIEVGRVGANGNTSTALQQSLQRMGVLIDTALTEVRMRVEPTVNLERIAVFEIMNEVGITAGFQARKREITLRMQGYTDLKVIADRQLVISALSNLVQNALKFTPPGGLVIVRTHQSGERILIEVQDQCGGLPEGAHEDLFTPFVQKSSDRTGVGLGLTITRNAVQRCHGTLRVANLPKDGCIFIIDLPADKLEIAKWP